MKKIRLATFLFILIFSLPAVSMAGGHNHDNSSGHHTKGHDHENKHIGYAHRVLSKAEELNLTNKQLGLITRVHLQHKKARKELRSELHKSMAQAHEGLMDPAIEDKTIQDAVKAHTETINKLAENALTERKRVNSILTEEQKKQITLMKEKHEHGGIRHFEEEGKKAQEKNKE